MNQEINTDSESTSVVEKVLPKREYAPYRHVCYKICKNCGHIFVLTDADIIYYVKKFGTIPMKCEVCRAKNKHIVESPVESTEN